MLYIVCNDKLLADFFYLFPRDIKFRLDNQAYLGSLILHLLKTRWSRVLVWISRIYANSENAGQKVGVFPYVFFMLRLHINLPFLWTHLQYCTWDFFNLDNWKKILLHLIGYFCEVLKTLKILINVLPPNLFHKLVTFFKRVCLTFLGMRRG